MTKSQAAQIAHWFHRTFDQRTAALEAGDGKIEWLDRGTRVSWTELVSFAETIGVTLHPTDQASLLPNLLGGRR